MTIAILATGDEIIQGDTLNTNGQWIAHTLNSEGLPLGLHLSCGDKEEEIVTALQFLCQQHDIVILIGGLGPSETGYRLETPYIEFKVRCGKAEINKVKERIEPLVSPHIIAPPEQKASERLQQLIVQSPHPITILDEVTGGLLQRLIQYPGNHHQLHFFNKGKGALHFHLSGLDEYWSQKETHQTSITIKYNNETEHGSEKHIIPYRSPLVVDYAAEWLSFRLFHLIKQLHQ
jgi:hypothetical protein